MPSPQHLSRGNRSRSSINTREAGLVRRMLSTAVLPAGPAPMTATSKTPLWTERIIAASPALTFQRDGLCGHHGSSGTRPRSQHVPRGRARRARCQTPQLAERYLGSVKENRPRFVVYWMSRFESEELGLKREARYATAVRRLAVGPDDIQVQVPGRDDLGKRDAPGLRHLVAGSARPAASATLLDPANE